MRPQSTIAVSQGNESRSLGVGVTIKPHHIQAKARLTTIKLTTDFDAHAYTVPPILAIDLLSVIKM